MRVAAAVSRRSWLAPAAVAALAAALGLFRLDRRSYWTDEAFNLVLVRDDWGGFIRTIGNQEPSQALYLVLFKPWVALVGQEEWRTRLPSVVALVLAAALLVVLGGQILDAWTGTIAGVLLATNAAVVEWSQYTRTYSLAVLAAVVTTALYVRARQRYELGPWLLYGAAGALSIYAHFYAGFVLLAHVGTALADRVRTPLRRVLAAWAVIAAGMVPFGLYVVAGTRSPVEWIPRPDAGTVWRSLHFASGFNAVLLAMAAAGAASLWLRRTRSCRSVLALLAGWVAAPLAGGLVVSIVKPALVPRFLIVAAPALALLAATAIRSFGPRPVRVLGLAAVLALATIRLAGVYERTPGNWEAAAGVARAAHARGAAVAVLPAFAWRALDVYAPGLPRVDAPTGRELVLVLWANAGTSRPRELGARFVGRAPYALTAERAYGDSVVVERWRRRG